MRKIHVGLFLLLLSLVPSVSFADQHLKQYQKSREQLTDDRIKECEQDGMAVTVFDLDQQWTVGASAIAQVVRYNLSTEKASLNPGVGAGVSFRYYPKGWMDPRGPKDIRNIKPDCRATTLDAPTVDENHKTGKLAFSILSVTPSMFVTKEEKSSDLGIQPALVIGVLRDLVTVGVGYHATGKGGGDWFFIFGLGYGFKF